MDVKELLLRQKTEKTCNPAEHTILPAVVSEDVMSIRQIFRI